MANLEVRVRHQSDARAMPFGEIPFRQEVIENVVSVIEAVGGEFGGVSIPDDATLMYQFAEDGEKAFLEVVVMPNS